MRIDIYYPSYLCVLIWCLKQSAFENLLHTFSYPYWWTMQWHLPTLGTQMCIVIRFCEAFLLYNSIFIKLLPLCQAEGHLGSCGWKEPLWIKVGAGWIKMGQAGINICHLLDQMGGYAPSVGCRHLRRVLQGGPGPSPVLFPFTWGGLILQHLCPSSCTGTLSLPVSDPEVLREGSYS